MDFKRIMLANPRVAGKRISANKNFCQYFSQQLLQEDKFIASVEKILEETKLAAKWLNLDITETVLIDNEEKVMEVLKQISKMGISISIDDFGTGYSSLSHIKNFTVDTLKIDKSFVTNVHSDEIDAAIVKAIMTIANQLQLNTVAEGIETQDQLLALWKENCKQIQGYLYSPPVSPRQIEQYIGSKGTVRGH